jgi:hypothetical protein
MIGNMDQDIGEPLPRIMGGYFEWGFHLAIFKRIIFSIAAHQFFHYSLRRRSGCQNIPVT